MYKDPHSKQPKRHLCCPRLVFLTKFICLPPLSFIVIIKKIYRGFGGRKWTKRNFESTLCWDWYICTHILPGALFTLHNFGLNCLSILQCHSLTLFTLGGGGCCPSRGKSNLANRPIVPQVGNFVTFNISLLSMFWAQLTFFEFLVPSTVFPLQNSRWAASPPPSA